MTPQHVISQLLESDSPYPQNLDLLKKIIITAYLGRLQINGLSPDNKVALGNYLFDNEQIMFDFTRLSNEKKALFMRWFLQPHQKDKTKSYLSGSTLNEYRGFTAEVFLTWWGRLISWFEKSYLDHWQINNLNLSLTYQLTGIDMCHGKNGILIGFNQFLVPGTGTKYKDPNDSQQEPLGNTKRVFITDNLVDQLIATNIKNINFETVCKSPHPQSIEVTNPQERFDKMYDYRKMQRFMSLKAWYIRIWGWIVPWLNDERDKNILVRDNRVSVLYETKNIEILRFLKTDEVLVREKRPDINNLVFCGGGPRIFAHVGVWKALNDANIHPEKFAGSSAGAIMALLCYLGYTAKEIEDLFRHFKQDHLVHFDISLNGFSKAHSLKTALDYAIAYKLNQIVTQYHIDYPVGPITFSTLESIRIKCPGCGIGKELVITGTNRTQEKTSYYSLSHSPHFEVSEAVKISGSFPVVYEPTEIDGEKHIDGGVLSNLPTEAFSDDHSTFLESEYGNNLKVFAVMFDDGPERRAIDRVMDKVYKENVVLNWIYRLLTGVSDPASGWEQDRMKLRKHAGQMILINLDKVSSSSFSVKEKLRQNMIEIGYAEAQAYLNLRYNKNERGTYENEELMYATFSSLGELLSYCCYRGDRRWFEIVYKLIEESTGVNKEALLQQAQELRYLYFNPAIPAPSTSPPDEKKSETVSDSSIKAVNYKILLTAYPVLLKLSTELLKDSADKKRFEDAFHSFMLHSPFACLQHFAKIKNETNVILHVFINLLKELKKNRSEIAYDSLNKMYALLTRDVDISQAEYFGRWDLTFEQSLRVLNLLSSESKIPLQKLLHSLRRRSEPMQTVIADVFYEDYNEGTFEEPTTLSI